MSEAHEEWSHARPPQLLKDFGGESGRARYEIAREEWYEREVGGGEMLPIYNENGSAAERKHQIGLRAEPWQWATKSYKERKRVRVRKMVSARTKSAEAGRARARMRHSCSAGTGGGYERSRRGAARSLRLQRARQ